MNLTIHIDGGSRGNPGPAAAGVCILDADTGRLLHESGIYLGRATNNVAEYRGLLHALDIAGRLGGRQLHIHTDSQLMARQIRGEYRVKSPDLLPLFEKASRQLQAFPRWTIQDVRREQNQRADALVNQALDAKADVVADANPAADPPSTGGHAPSPAPAAMSSAHWFEARFPAATGKACPAPTGKGSVYPFGPTVPAGLCLYAARAILDAGLLDADGGRHVQRRARCPRCDAAIELRPGNDP
jgi:ribonuclease HI